MCNYDNHYPNNQKNIKKAQQNTYWPGILLERARTEKALRLET